MASFLYVEIGPFSHSLTPVRNYTQQEYVESIDRWRKEIAHNGKLKNNGGTISIRPSPAPRDS